MEKVTEKCVKPKSSTRETKKKRTGKRKELSPLRDKPKSVKTSFLLLTLDRGPVTRPMIPVLLLILYQECEPSRTSGVSDIPYHSNSSVNISHE